MSRVYDIAVVGSGFAGSLIAMIAQRLGRSVILLERGRHPRFMIGESSTPLSNLLLEELITRYDLPGIRPLTKWGSWQQSYPHIGCGMKRGFTFYHHVPGQPDAPDPERRNQLLVAASPHDGIADTHWYRADFDAFIAQQAQSMGVEYVDEVRLERYAENSHYVELAGKRQGGDAVFHAEFVIDATGPRGFLHHALRLPEASFPGYPATQALYSHFAHVRPLQHADLEAPPYPAERAAVHHIFDGGWVWMLHFNNGVTSAGVVATDAAATELALHDGSAAWERLLHLLPALREQFVQAEATRPFVHVKRLPFLSSSVHGERWAMLPSAAGFIDPLLSTGFPLALLGISRLAEILAQDWESPRFHPRLQQYAAQTFDELHATARLIAALYANMHRFPVFTALSLLYFAAASFSETARRLRKPYLAPSFLLHDHPIFGPACRALLEQALYIGSEEDEAALIADIMRTIEPLDVAGLCRRDRRNWYPVEAEDLLRSASKVHANRDEIMQSLARSGFYA